MTRNPDTERCGAKAAKKSNVLRMTSSSMEHLTRAGRKAGIVEIPCFLPRPDLTVNGTGNFGHPWRTFVPVGATSLKKRCNVLSYLPACENSYVKSFRDDVVGGGTQTGRVNRGTCIRAGNSLNTCAESSRISTRKE